MQNESKNDNGISEEGTAWLKLATAAPDFEDTSFEGVPDAHTGPTVCIKQFVTSTVVAQAGKATYYIATPQPGVAHWRTEVDVDTDWINGQVLVPAVFPKSDQIFDNILHDTSPSTDYGGSNTRQIAQFRISSSQFEIACLNNAFNQYGSITAWKVPLRLQVEAERLTNRGGSTTQETRQTIHGIEGVRSKVIGSMAYTAPVRDGAYAVTMCREDEFEWSQLRDHECLSSSTWANFDAPPVSTGSQVHANFAGPMVGFDNAFDSIIFRIDVPAGVENQSFLLKRWLTFEAEPVFNSLLWGVSHLSPRKDEVALRLYHEMARVLPSACPVRDNPDFWQEVLRIVDESSNVLSYVPGPVGQVAKGVHAVTQALEGRPARKRPTKKRNKKKKTFKAKPNKR